MSYEITSAREIPDAEYYVTGTDTFFSYSILCATKDKVVLPCESRAEAEIVAANARNRSDQKYVSIRLTKPRITTGTRWSLLTKENGAARWFRPGGFCRCR